MGYKRMLTMLLALSMLLSLLAGCGRTDEPVYLDQVFLEEIDLEVEAVALSDAPAAKDTLLLPEAPGTVVKQSKKATIDYSNTKDGYVMVQFTDTTTKKLKVQVAGPTTTYTYDLPASGWTTYPLSDGNGDYKVTVL